MSPDGYFSITTVRQQNQDTAWGHWDAQLYPCHGTHRACNHATITMQEDIVTTVQTQCPQKLRHLLTLGSHEASCDRRWEGVLESRLEVLETRLSVTFTEDAAVMECSDL